MDALTKLHNCFREGVIPEKFKKILKSFFTSYKDTLISRGKDMSYINTTLCTFLELIRNQFVSPYRFEPYHQGLRVPFDYYGFGNEFFRPIVDIENSRILKLSNVDRMIVQLQNKDNVILFGNHQTEIEPQLISILLEETHPNFAANMIFVSGDRVRIDPVAAPLSMGRNLLCIYSKKYIDVPPEMRARKQQYNQRSLNVLAELLNDGGKCIYVAPSGGRDRLNEHGIPEIAPFDPQSVELFMLMAQKSQKCVHFYPMALDTYDVLPPPKESSVEIGEERHYNYSDIAICFGDEISIDAFPSSEGLSKIERRRVRADYIRGLVKYDYDIITGN